MEQFAFEDVVAHDSVVLGARGGRGVARDLPGLSPFRRARRPGRVRRHRDRRHARRARHGPRAPVRWAAGGVGHARALRGAATRAARTPMGRSWAAPRSRFSLFAVASRPMPRRNAKSPRSGGPKSRLRDWIGAATFFIVLTALTVLTGPAARDRSARTRRLPPSRHAICRASAPEGTRCSAAPGALIKPSPDCYARERPRASRAEGMRFP